MSQIYTITNLLSDIVIFLILCGRQNGSFAVLVQLKRNLLVVRDRLQRWT